MTPTAPPPRWAFLLLGALSFALEHGPALLVGIAVVAAALLASW